MAVCRGEVRSRNQSEGELDEEKYTEIYKIAGKDQPLTSS